MVAVGVRGCIHVLQAANIFSLIESEVLHVAASLWGFLFLVSVGLKEKKKKKWL